MTKLKPSFTCLIGTFLLICIVPDVFAQKTQKEPFKVDHRWDVSLDAYNLLKSGTPHVLFRYAPNPEKFAYRLGIGDIHLSHSAVFEIDPQKVKDLIYEQKSITVNIEAGVEFRKTKEKLQLYAGPNISYRVSKGFINYNDQHIPDNYQPGRLGRVGLGPVAGIRYFIWKQLAVSAESNLEFYYHYNRLPNNNTSNTGKHNTLGFNYLPLKALNISFFF